MADPKKDALENLRAKLESARNRAGAALANTDVSALAARCETHKPGKNATGWKNPYPKTDPRSVLLEYQFAWWFDRSRFKAGLMSRQAGKDFSSEGEAAEDCQQRKTEWMIAAPSERQALDSLEQGKTWALAFDLSVTDYKEERSGSSESVLKSAEIIYNNGSKHRAVPGRPDTVRGRSANLLLTEVDFFEDPDATWRAILPSITNPLRGGEKKVRLITTPNRIGGLMHKIWTTHSSQKMKWSRHLVTIYHAVLMGLPVNIAELNEAFNDPEGWAQEYECQFLDASAVLLPYELLATCESPEATTAIDPDFFTSTHDPRPFVMGIDFARKRDLSVAWTDELLGNLTHCREVLEMRDMSTPDQIDLLRPRIRRARRVCLDYTGAGVGMGDFLVKEFGEYNPGKHQFGKIELCVFTNSLKVELFSKLRMAFEQNRTRIPVNRAIREDFHSMQRVTSTSGNVSYRAPHTEDGHADRCTAKALAQRAAGSGTAPVACAQISNAFVSPPTNFFGIGRVQPKKGAPL
jgi:phage FluMu gp28-like protein